MNPILASSVDLKGKVFCFIRMPEMTENQRGVFIADFNSYFSEYITTTSHLFASGRVWIPLTGMGYDWFSLKEIFFIIKNVLEEQRYITLRGSEAEFTISIPDTKEGRMLLKEVTGEGNSVVDSIPFHLDNVEVQDKLNREPIAKSLAGLINNNIFSKKELNYSFMVHLRGEWGSGKSTFLNLVEKHLSDTDRQWMVIQYNAWQNQHITPPWWTFIDQVYRQTLKRLGIRKRLKLVVKEYYRRIVWYGGWFKIAILLLTLVLLVLFVRFGGGFLTYVMEWFDGKLEIDSDISKEKSFDIISKFLASVATVLGLFFSFSKFLSTPLKSSEEAISFMNRASDPMNRIKKHFNSLIADIHNCGYEVAVFIDDIDRCEKKFTIELLEGIQTLFRKQRVLYVVAGDHNWLSACFENHYKEFKDSITRNEEKLGDLFLEKAFQLTVRMPNISDGAKQKYWDFILGVEETEKSFIRALNTEEEQTIKQEIKKAYSLGSDAMEKVGSQYDLSSEQFSKMAIEALDEDDADVVHLFKEHYKIINPNPRLIKRLANNYTINRNILIAEQKSFDPGKLFRWLIADEMFPFLRKDITSLTGVTIETYLNSLRIHPQNLQVLKVLILDSNGTGGGKLEVADIKEFIGI